MPEMIPLGWFHTIMGIIAITSGAISLSSFNEISLRNRSGQIYLAATLITAGTALAIFQRGEFGPGHALAVLTLVAMAVGAIAETMKPIGKWSRYLQALSYSSTLLFHFIPAVTDGLMRLPIGNPAVTDFADPLLRGSYMVLLALFLIGITLQFRWLRRQPD